MASLVTPSFWKVCGNCHGTNIITSPISDVHCNVCHLKSNVQKPSYLHAFIPGGTLSIKFEIYMCQTTIFRGDIK
jgi:DnaJ-class molecular chaperone